MYAVTSSGSMIYNWNEICSCNDLSSTVDRVHPCDEKIGCLISFAHNTLPFTGSARLIPLDGAIYPSIVQDILNYVSKATKLEQISKKYKDYVYGNVFTWVLDKHKEHFFRCKDKAEKLYDVLTHIQLRMSKYRKMKIYNPLGQTYSQTVV